jgi:hypothetical protein
MRGPIDYIIVGFDKPNFDGSILKEVANAVEAGSINLIALSAIIKDKEGHVTLLDISEINNEYIINFTQKIHLQSNLIDQDDIDEVADLLAEDSAAGLLIIEHLWAKPLKRAIINANGYLISDGRIHPDALQLINNEGEA